MGDQNRKQLQWQTRRINMEQKYYTFYCHRLMKPIGDGICCLACKDFQRAKPDENKKCHYEEITGIYTREV